MPARLTRTIASLFMVLTSYWLYTLLAVPWIEPVAQEAPLPATPPGHPPVKSATEPPTARFLHLLEPWFAADSWERANAKILKNHQLMVLLQDYEPLDDGRQLQLRPCTVVFNPLAAAAEGEEPSSTPTTLILQAPEGAVLEFDRPLDLAQGGLGKLLGGRLVGEVTMWSRPSAAGAADDIHIVTRNVQMNSQQIWTPHDVRFRYGRHTGRGRDLMINLTTNESGDVRRLPSETPMRLRSLELVHLDQLTLASIGSADTAKQPGREPSAAAQPNAPIALHVRCEGPLLFDFVGGSATLKKKVSIQRVGGADQPDWLTCELLALQFRSQKKPPADATATKPAVLAGASWRQPAFELSQIAALGNPAILNAPSRSIHAQAEKLELHLSHNLILLQDSQQAVLSYGVHTFRGPRMQYHLDPEGGPGRAEIRGAGEYRGEMRKEEVLVDWQKGLEFGPLDGLYRLAVDGQARVRWASDHQLAADELHVWLQAATSDADPNRQPPAATGSARAPLVPLAGPTQQAADPLTALADDWRPHRVVARKDVHVQTPQLIGQTEFAEVRFIGMEREAYPANATAGPNLAGPLEPANGTQAPRKPTRRFGLRGQELHVVISTMQRTPSLQSVKVKGGVELRELTTAGTEPLFEITGDVVELDQQDSAAGDARGRVSGEPAVIRTRGMEVSGRSIRLDQTRNRIWIDGAGSAFVPLPDRIAAQLSRRRATAQVSWQDAMEFDGRTISCQRGVEIRGPAQIATADSLQATLSEPVRLQTMGHAAVENAGHEKAKKALELAEVALTGHVWLENRTFDDAGLASIDELSLESLSFRQQTGDLFGVGPGWISSVRFLGSVPLGNALQDRQPSLSHTLVEFQKRLQGSMKTREISVSDQVRAIHGPVDNWQERLRFDEPAGLSPNSVFMRCTVLTVAQMGPSREPSLEFVASGNTEIEGRTFVARAQQVRYAQAKDSLVMEGDGRSVAQLRYQNRIGGTLQQAAARKIQYWIGENRATVDGVVFGDFNLPP